MLIAGAASSQSAGGTGAGGDGDVDGEGEDTLGTWARDAGDSGASRSPEGGVRRARPQTVWVKPKSSEPSPHTTPSPGPSTANASGDGDDLTLASVVDGLGVDAEALAGELGGLSTEDHPEDPDPDADSDEVEEDIPEEISAKKGPGWVSAR